ncbi:MAG: hypothetical protein Q4F58_02925 [Candidatus Saccharibacteria bacterium]|nr:hypothetical protein [Candidatus Saccharibacteria bacterium]
MDLRGWHKKIKERFLRFRKEKLKTWVLLLILVPLLFIDATLLRLNHVKMTELRDAVMAADEANDDAAIADGLVALKEFVFSHIVINVVEDNGEQVVSFGTGPFYLEHQYVRAATAALNDAEAKFAGDSNPNGNIYGMAGDTCKTLALANGWTWDNPNFINCMITEINKYPSATEIQDTIIASLPSTELFRHNYASPVWAPSILGFLLLITGIVIVVIFIRFLVWLVLRLSLLFI